MAREEKAATLISIPVAVIIIKKNTPESSSTGEKVLSAQGYNASQKCQGSGGFKQLFTSYPQSGAERDEHSICNPSLHYTVKTTARKWDPPMGGSTLQLIQFRYPSTGGTEVHLSGYSRFYEVDSNNHLTVAVVVLHSVGLHSTMTCRAHLSPGDLSVGQSQ